MVNESIIEKLTAKDDKYACALSLLRLLHR